MSGVQAHLENPELGEAVKGYFRADPVSRECSLYLDSDR